MTWLIDGRRLARKVKNAAELRTVSSARHSDERPCQTCPTCGSSVSQEVIAEDWPGLPAGVKFDPSDKELLEHLTAKVGSSTLKSHPFIDEFIPTLSFEDGICYTHPEKLPGVRCDGTSSHFFHRPANAYTTGTRKRRKIQNDSENASETRWHKTGKTRAVVENGIQYGYKKIMVLYTGFAKNMKPNKTCWVMHQYHIGKHEEEGDGELVVSKIFYQTQPRQTNGERKMDPLEENYEHAENFKSTYVGDANKPNAGGIPLTPNMFAPSRPQKSKNTQVNHVEGPLLHENQEVKHNQLSLSEARVNHVEGPLLHENQEAKPTKLPLSEARVNHVEGPLLHENQEDKHNQLPLSEARCDQLNEPTDIALKQTNAFSAEQEALANGGGGTSNFEPFNVNSQDQAIPFDSQEMANMELCTNESQLAAVANAFLSSSDPANNLQCDEDIRSFPDGGLAKSIENDARHLFRELGFTFDTEPCVPQKFSLEDIMLDTPPDISVVDLVGSQDSVDWLDKKVLETGISFRACAPKWAA